MISVCDSFSASYPPYICMYICILVIAAWYTSRYVMISIVYMHMQLLSPSTCGTIRATNASRHAKSIMGPECSTNLRSELCIIAIGHPLALQSAQQHRSEGETERISTICRHACLYIYIYTLDPEKFDLRIYICRPF